ncbi:MAG TPA: pantetheine-phosphate adenylyltransferase [Alphaproteobacteria bacterium]|nr:pantetheine-phosphate adenylyltransferase [Alphaproteobacteria bacterium]
MKSIGVYPGSFDPITKGHVDIIKRSAKLVDKLVIGVLNNANKKCWFTPEERKELIEKTIADVDNIEVKLFDGLLVDFMQQNNANLIIRGLRSVSDYEYELQLALGNKTLADFDLETIFIPASKDYLYLSSSIVREVASHGGCLEKFLNAEIIKDVEARAKDK